MPRINSASLAAVLVTAGIVLTGCDQSGHSNPVAVTPEPWLSSVSGTVRVSPPRAAQIVPATPAELVDALRTAYQSRDLALFSALLSDAPGAQFQFGSATSNSWDRAEERRIHLRMFTPAAIPSSEAPLPLELWMSSIDATFVPASPFVDQPDLYRDPLGNRDGLDPARWRAHVAEFLTNAFFETQGDTDYRVQARVRFAVIEDLARGAGPAKRFRLYRWEELPTGASTAEATSWATLKQLYR